MFIPPAAVNPPVHFPALLTAEPAASRATPGRDAASPPPPRASENPDGPATHPRPGDPATTPARRGRKPVATPERFASICSRLAEGETERAACLAAGVGLTTWNAAKRRDAALRGCVADARQEWARRRHVRHLWALRESQWSRAAGRKALRPTPTKQARLVVWYLTFRVSLDVAAIAPTEIVAACVRFGLDVDGWERQERAFGLLAKVYAKRAKIRGDRAAVAPLRLVGLDLNNWPEPAGWAEEDAFSRYRP